MERQARFRLLDLDQPVACLSEAFGRAGIANARPTREGKNFELGSTISGKALSFPVLAG